MTDLLIDTHIVVWALFEPTKLSPAASSLIEATVFGGRRILISAITPIEVTYLVEKGRLPGNILAAIWTVYSSPTLPCEILPVCADVARVFDRIPRATVPDMPDRIVAATALYYAIPLVSADKRIRALSVQGLSVVW
jgi:PIN domain nuclease of toxin-antitoxin system